MSVRNVKATITLQLFPYMNDGLLRERIARDAKKILEGFQIRNVEPECGSVSFIFDNVNDLQKKQLADTKDQIMYASAISRAIGCEIVRLPARFRVVTHDTSKPDGNAVFTAKLSIRMKKVAHD